MKLLELRVERFRSFIKPQRFVFPQEPGLYFLQGDNQVEPRLGSNGAGKSSVWDALTWVAFDRTTRGLRAGDVSNWLNSKDTVVELDYEDGPGTNFTVSRTWGPNSWTLRDNVLFTSPVIDLTKSPDNPFLAALQLELLPWLCCVVMGQGRPMFLDLDAGAKAELFGQVLNLDKWLERSENASKQATTQDKANHDLEVQLASLEGELANLAHTTTNVDQAAAKWQTERDQQLVALKRRYQDALTDQSKKREAKEAAEARLERPRTNLRQLTADLEHTTKKFQDHVNKWVTPLAGEVAATRSLIRQKLDERSGFNEMDVCPTCNQPVSGDHARKAMQRIDATIEALERRLGADEVALLNLKREESNFKEQIRDIEEAAKDRRDEVGDLEHDARDAQRAYEYLDRDLDNLEKEAERLEAQANPYTDIQADSTSKRRRLEEARATLALQLDHGRQRHARLSHWVKGFKEIRLFQIAEALRSLEVEVNSCVTALGLVDWELQFAVDKTTKRGTIQKGFNVTVLSPHNEAAVPWEAWSGGEGQRLRLAGNMGLGDLIRARTGTNINLEVWDEPTQGMTPQGVTDLLDCLAERARAESRPIWVVDHHSLGYGAFAGVATVVKTAVGSQILPVEKM